MQSKIIAIIALASSTLIGVSALADSPLITASGKQCRAKWLSGPGAFRIWDGDLNDDDYCYVKWGLEDDDDNDLVNRMSRPQDVGGYGDYEVPGAGCQPEIHWRVCKERQNDPDICSSIRSDAT